MLLRFLFLSHWDRELPCSEKNKVTGGTTWWWCGRNSGLDSELEMPVCTRAKSLQSCLTHCDAMHRGLPDFSVHGILLARTLERVACPPPGDLSDPGTEPPWFLSPALTGRFFITSTTWKALEMAIKYQSGGLLLGNWTCNSGA